MDGEVGMTADAGQPSAGGVDEFWVDVHGKDIVLAEAMGQQGGVVASAGPDLQGPLRKPGSVDSEDANAAVTKGQHHLVGGGV
jgi:hypothetical protein